MSAAPAAHVAVVGGGWAGCAAAVTLARAGVRVTLLEQARVARRPRAPRRAGRHRARQRPASAGRRVPRRRSISSPKCTAGERARRCSSACRSRCARSATRRRDGRRAGRVAAACAACISPARCSRRAASSWRERIALLTGFRRLARADSACPKARPSASASPARRCTRWKSVWEPLCIAALNTPPEAASAQHFVNVLRETFGGGARASDMLVPAADLSALFPEAAARFVGARGGSVRTGVTVRSIARAGERIEVVDRHGRASRATRRSSPSGRTSSPRRSGRPARKPAWRAPLAARRGVRVRVDHDDLPRSCRAVASAAAADAARRRARTVDLRPQRDAARRASRRRARTGRRGDQHRRTAQRARPGDARERGRRAAAAPAPHAARRSPGRASSPSSARRMPARRRSPARSAGRIDERRLSRRRLHRSRFSGDARGGDAQRRSRRGRAAARPAHRFRADRARTEHATVGPGATSCRTHPAHAALVATRRFASRQDAPRRSA